ncbi:MAG: oligosaccharide flippase family protein [Gemmataceae bacterium]
MSIMTAPNDTTNQTPEPQRAPTNSTTKRQWLRAGLLGIGWMSLAQFACLAIRLGSNLILTRLLAPEVYGILGTAMAVVTMFEWLSDLGIQTTLVRHPKGGQRTFLLTGWWLGLGRAVMIALLGASAAWPLASGYSAPALFVVLLVLSTRPLLYALRSPGIHLLKRELNYRSLFLEEVAQTAVGTIVSLSVAYFFASIWAIVVGTVAGTITAVVASYLLCPMRLEWAWNREASKELVTVGGRILVNTLVMAAWLNIDRLLGLWFVPVKEMGLYFVALNLAAVGEGFLARTCDVHYSMLARLPNLQAQMDWHKQMKARLVFWGSPLLILGVITAPTVIRILYDPRYWSAGVLFGVFAARVAVRFVGQFHFQFCLIQAKVFGTTIAYAFAVALQCALMPVMCSELGVFGLALSTLMSTATVTLIQAIFVWWQYGFGLRSTLLVIGSTTVATILVWKLAETWELM